MKIELKGAKDVKAATEQSVDLLVVGAFASKASAAAASKTTATKKTAAKPAKSAAWAGNSALDAIDAALGGALSAQAARDEFSGKSGSTLCIATHGKLRARCVLVIGLGDSATLDRAHLRSFAARAARQGNSEKATTLAIVAPSSEPAHLRALAEGLPLGAYRFTKYFTGDRLPKATLATAFVFTDKLTPAAKAAVDVGGKIGDAVCIARDLVNEPPNVLNAPVFADRARAVCRAGGLKIQVFNKAEIARRGMRLLMAVNQGSTIEPRFVHMTYTPKAIRGTKPKRLVFVGKGLTFDSGGLCIKTAEGMLEMKIDMGGGANVVALMAAVAALKPNVEVHGIFAATDNMPDGSAYQPGDVFKSLDGKTVEIINTDAEGRLVLADALAYARNLKPDLMIDNATLTGACMVALGPNCSGFYANRDDVAAEFATAVKTAGEQMWRMPLLEDLRDQLKSEIADLKHTGSRYGGSITASLFLREFVGDCAWIHCDIAGPVTTGAPSGFYVKGATGHGVLSFLEIVEQYAQKA